MSGGQWEVLTEENAIVSVGRGGGINLGESLGRISLRAIVCLTVKSGRLSNTWAFVSSPVKSIISPLLSHREVRIRKVG